MNELQKNKHENVMFIKDEKPAISIIIATFNAFSYTRACIETLRTKTVDAEWHLIVVDNGSTDETLGWLRDQSDLTLIENGKNLGFVQANNIGLRHVPEQHDVLFLNNDTQIIQENWLTKLRDTANGHPTYGIVGCRLVDEMDQTTHNGTFLSRDSWRGWPLGGREEDIGQFFGTREVEGVVGACLYLRRDARTVLQGFDPDYISYFEDTDLCFRAKQAGYKVVCVMDVKVQHSPGTTSKENNIDLESLMKPSQVVFRSKWESQLSRESAKPIIWQSEMGRATGYSSSCRGLLRELDGEDFEIRYGYVGGSSYSEMPFGDPRLEQMRHRKKSIRYPQVIYSQGDYFYRNGGTHRIGYTMLEVDGLPAEWVHQANEMDEVWVPSHFNLETFQNAGVHVPMHVMPLGVDPDYFHPKIHSERFSERYTFLSVFAWGERKNPTGLIRAFKRAFDARDDVLLIIKYMHPGNPDLLEYLSSRDLATQTAPILLLHHSSIPGYQMGCMYRAADCFVSATHGEGWGMPILEAMSCGLPVIATNWSGQTEFLNSENSYPINVKGLIPAVSECPYYDNLNWAEPDEDHLVDLLRHVYNHREEAENKGLRASKEVSQKWTWTTAANRIANRLKEITG